MQRKIAQPEIDSLAGQFRCLTIIREKGQLCRLIMSAIDHINGPAPPGFLAVIDFTKIEHLPLTDLAVRQSLVFDYGPLPIIPYSFFRNVRLLFSFCEKTEAYNPNYITTSVVFLLSIFWNNLGPEEVFFMSGKTCFSKRQDDLMMLLSIRVSVSRYSLCQADPILFRFSLTFLPQLLLKVGKTLGFVGITNRD